ncbi:HIT family protein [Nesterenkonia muleiensis]|uniref:HIT family protein n=1 Tax=Nesterenkonia muleiensis TaxID=2282648 RepID=UPI000E771042|nr:HIT family protein [Nesterenkonia muleiensis]
MENQDCVFCGIVEDPSESDVVWKDDGVIAFMDINPVTDGHVLVIPRRHHVGLIDLPEATAAHMMRVAQSIARALRASQLRCEGINLFFADGEAAFQEIFHSHLHIFPRYEGDGFVVEALWEGRSRESLRASAEAIRRELV